MKRTILGRLGMQKSLLETVNRFHSSRMLRLLIKSLFTSFHLRSQLQVSSLSDFFLCHTFDALLLPQVTPRKSILVSFSLEGMG